jgi:hypothetical protein
MGHTLLITIVERIATRLSSVKCGARLHAYQDASKACRSGTSRVSLTAESSFPHLQLPPEGCLIMLHSVTGHEPFFETRLKCNTRCSLPNSSPADQAGACWS